MKPPPRTSSEPMARDRKAEHIRLALDEGIQGKQNFFDEYRFEHDALPECSLADIDTSVEFLGRRLAAPLVVSCMTGGTQSALRINRNLAVAAERCGVAMGVGSQRRALEDPALSATFQVRERAPSVPLLANLGAVQLNYGFGLEECRQAVEMIEADALVFHLNALQEAIQPEGQTDFRGLLKKLGAIARALPVPVIVKEVGCGISAATARALRDEGISIVDTAGLGGTSWARIEARRAGDVELGEAFADWGIPSPEAIARLRAVEGLTIIGSGGLRDGVDVAKAIALGADLAAMAYPFLRAATESTAATVVRIGRVVRELQIAMFCVGARTVTELKRAPLERRR